MDDNIGLSVACSGNLKHLVGGHVKTAYYPVAVTATHPPAHRGQHRVAPSVYPCVGRRHFKAVGSAHAGSVCLADIMMSHRALDAEAPLTFSCCLDHRCNTSFQAPGESPGKKERWRSQSSEAGDSAIGNRDGQNNRSGMFFKLT